MTETASHREHAFDRLTDLLALSPQEFDRFLPDLMAWFAFSKIIHDSGGEVERMLWIDDGRPGELDRVEVTDKATGETQVIPMPRSSWKVSP